MAPRQCGIGRSTESGKTLYCLLDKGHKDDCRWDLPRPAPPIQKGDTIILAGRVVGFQAIEARVLDIEREASLFDLDGKPLKHGATVVKYDTVLTLVDIRTPVRTIWNRMRPKVTLSVTFDASGEEGMVSRRLTIAELRAWAIQCPVDGIVSEWLLEHLSRGPMS
jgi:hypothetical protein